MRIKTRVIFVKCSKSNQVVENQTIEVHKTVYPSAKVILDATIKEYDFEASRKQSIETRAGILLAFTGSILVYFLTNFKINLRSDSISWNQLMTMLAITLLGYAIYLQIKVFGSKEYKRIKCSSFNNEFAKYKEEDVQVSLFNTYNDAILLNQKQNEEKMKYFNESLYTVLVSLIMTTICLVLK